MRARRGEGEGGERRRKRKSQEGKNACKGEEGEEKEGKGEKRCLWMKNGGGRGGERGGRMFVKEKRGGEEKGGKGRF